MKKLLILPLLVSLLTRLTAETPIDFSPNREIFSCGPTTVYFVYNNAVEADLIYWDFGDGTGGSGMNPSHTYIDNGVYTVKLVIIDNNVRDSVVKENFVTVRPVPVSQMKVEHQREDLFNQYLFTSESVHHADSFDALRWYIGKDTLEGEKVKYTFPGKGEYTVTHVATNNYGCSHESSTTIKVSDNTVDPVGLDDRTGNPALAVYPNPADHSLFVKSGAGRVQLSLSDLLGSRKEVPVTETAGGLMIDTRSLATGVYFLTLQSETGALVSRRIAVAH